MKTKLAILAVVTALISGVAITNASAIKTWGAETLKYSDLNSNFNHIHNTMVGGHGARLVDSDVSASAAIAGTKLAAPVSWLKKVAFVTTTCSASPCTMAANSGFTAITRTGVGTYVLNFSALPNTDYGVLISSINTPVAASFCFGNGTAPTTTTYTFECVTHAGALNDTKFIVALFDND